MTKLDLSKYKRMPAVGVAMTPFPHFVHSDDSAISVEMLMQEHGIRHIPVQEKGHVMGLISERDLHRLANPALPQVDKATIRARDILLPDLFIVEMDTPLDQVVTSMAERHIGCAIVVKHEKLVGILSTTDICRALAQVLSSYFSTTDEGDAA
jgi:acetoin utilization protein AcuB